MQAVDAGVWPPRPAQFLSGSVTSFTFAARRPRYQDKSGLIP